MQRFDSAFSGGSGTQADPYKISSQADLEQLARDVNSEGNEGNYDANRYKGKYFKLTNDIALTGNWAPIGTSTFYVFAGNFDGDGHIISNLTINQTEGFSYVSGLFGYVYTGRISNLHLTNVNTNSNAVNVGTIAAYTYGYIANDNDAYITNCSA